MVNKQSEISYNDQCPKCNGLEVEHSDWRDNEFIYVTYYCYECHCRWREKIDFRN